MTSEPDYHGEPADREGFRWWVTRTNRKPGAWRHKLNNGQPDPTVVEEAISYKELPTPELRTQFCLLAAGLLPATPQPEVAGAGGQELAL